MKDKDISNSKLMLTLIIGLVCSTMILVTDGKTGGGWFIVGLFCVWG